MTLNDLLDKVCNGMSDNMTSKKLGINRVTFSNYRNGHTIPKDEIVDRMIESSGVNPLEAYLAVYAEKVSNPQVAEQFRHLSA